MGSIETLTLWNEGVSLVEKKEYTQALEKFQEVPEQSAKILFNIAICKIILCDVEGSLSIAENILKRDEHMAVGFYLRGIINFKLQRFSEAFTDFELAHQKLRGRNVIDYNQLGLRYKLYACEPLHNAAVTCAVLGERPKAINLLYQASECKTEKRHSIIDNTITLVDSGTRANILDIPYPDMIYRPPKTKLANLQKKDYLGKAKVKVITAVEGSDAQPGFEAPRKMSLGLLNLERLNKSSSSVPSSPQAARKKLSPKVERREESRKMSLLDLMGGGASKLKNMFPLGGGDLKPAKSDSNLTSEKDAKDSESGRKSSLVNSSSSINTTGSKTLRDVLPPPPNKPIPPAPQKPAPVLTLRSSDQLISKSKTETMNPPTIAVSSHDDEEDNDYTYASEPNRLAERLEALKQFEENKNRKFNNHGNSVVKPSDVIRSQQKSSPSREIEDESNPSLPPRKYNLPPKPPSKQQPRNSSSVCIELTCTDTIKFHVERNTCLEDLLTRSCSVFNLEPGTVDLWYMRSVDGEYIPVNNQDDMTRLWAGVKDSLSLWCFSKQ